MSQTAVGTKCIHIGVQNRSVCDVCVIIEIGMVKGWSDREGMGSYLIWGIGKLDTMGLKEVAGWACGCQRLLSCIELRA